jgi:thiol-disulfide isomerase/thioredoxin
MRTPSKTTLTAGLVVAAAALATNQASLAEPPPAPPPDRIDPMALADVEGRSIRIPDGESRCTIVVFLARDCPLVQAYAPRLAAIARRFAPHGVRMVGLGVHPRDSRESLAAFASDALAGAAIVADPDGRLARTFGATRTPEVFLLDRDGTILYSGRIDDQYGFSEGRKFIRPAPTHESLALAVEDALAGRPIGTPRTQPEGCRIARPRPAAVDASATWSRDVSRLFARACQDCHRKGQIGPFPLTTFAETKGWQDMILEVVESRRMPPWGAEGDFGVFENDPRLSADEIDLVRKWVLAGAPEGDPAEAPPPATFPMQWRSFVPDRIVFMSDRPFRTPASGVIEYQYFVADPHFEKDVWADGFECLPGNPRVVHHVSIYAVPPDEGVSPADNPLLLRRLLFGYNPGSGPLLLPKGTARRIPAGSRFVFQLHYQATGEPEEDNSCLGLRLVDPESVQYPIDTRLMLNQALDIPPGAGDYRMAAEYRVGEPVDLRLLVPHMHLRGRSFRIDATYPDGRRELLLDVPRYDFNWQHTYVFREPRRLPEGTVLRSEAVFDNSASNPSNPDPSARVRWGDQVWDEMMVVSFCVTPLAPDRNWVPRDSFLQTTGAWEGRSLRIFIVGGVLAAAAVLLWAIRSRRRSNRL